MGISTRRTVVRNNGNINKGGSKTIYSYNKEGSVSSIRTVRGSINNKRGGSDNQYSITTETRDQPPKNSSVKRESARSSSGDGSGLLLGIAFILFLGVFWVIWKGLVWLYEAIFD